MTFTSTLEPNDPEVTHVTGRQECIWSRAWKHVLETDTVLANPNVSLLLYKSQPAAKEQTVLCTQLGLILLSPPDLY